MNILDNPERCCGCYACYSTCPTSAITMEENEEGFRVPVIADDKCINCGSCRSVCPVQHVTYEHPKPTVYALQANDSIREGSSSGGAAAILSKYVLAHGGIVCGCGFDKNFEAHHVIIDKEEELPLISRTKYVQSRIEDNFKEIKKALLADRLTLFVGTPCQVAGLNGYLRNLRNSDKLITVDLICHGVPSPMALRKFYKTKVGDLSKVKHVDFRTKRNGWSSNYEMAITYTNGTVKYFPKKDNDYLKAFGSNLINRTSCAGCAFARSTRQGDFSVGDFWNINGYKPEMNDKKGTSLLLVNSEKATRIFKEISSDAGLFTEQIPLATATVKNSPIHRPPRTDKRRNDFLETLAKTDIFPLESSQMLHPYDLGIVSWWFMKNYGNVLEAYAFSKVMESMGKKCLFIDIPTTQWPTDKSLRAAHTFPHRFLTQFCHTSSSYDTNDAKQMQALYNSCNAFCVANDRVWQWEQIKDLYSYYYLEFAKDKPKFSYFTSFADSEYQCDDPRITQKIKNLLQDFRLIGVRDSNDVTLCQNHLSANAQIVCDPLFLCDPSVLIELAGKPKANRHKLSAFFVSCNEDRNKALHQVANAMNTEADVTFIPVTGKTDKLMTDYPIIKDIPVSEWLKHIVSSELVLTDSYAVSCLCIILDIPFIAIHNDKSNNDVFTTMMKTFGLEHRLVKNTKQILTVPSILKAQPDYTKAKEQIEIAKASSLELLKQIF